MKTQVSKILPFVLIVLMIFSIIPVAIADSTNLSELSNEELTALQEKVYDEIRVRKLLDDKTIPIWNGSEKVLVYEDNYVLITFNGLYAWTSSWYIPKLMITNKTNKTLYFKWEKVFFDNASVSPSNGGALEVPANGKLAFQTGNKCSITLKDYIDAYDETMLRVLRFNFSLRDENSKTIKEASLSVRCDIDLTNPNQ